MSFSNSRFKLGILYKNVNSFRLLGFQPNPPFICREVKGNKRGASHDLQLYFSNIAL